MLKYKAEDNISTMLKSETRRSTGLDSRTTIGGQTHTRLLMHFKVWGSHQPESRTVVTLPYTNYLTKILYITSLWSHFWNLNISNSTPFIMVDWNFLIFLTSEAGKDNNSLISVGQNFNKQLNHFSLCIKSFCQRGPRKYGQGLSYD